MYASTSRGQLGFFLVDDIAGIVGIAKGAQTILHDVNGMFGHSSDDQDRADRLNYIVNAVLAGSVLAGRAILGGLTPDGIGASSERNAWQQSYQQLLIDAPSTMAEAAAAGPYWHYGSDGGKHPLSPGMRQEIAADLRARGVQYPTNGRYIGSPLGSSSSSNGASSSGGASSGGVVRSGGIMLPPMQTTAPFNWTPYLIGGGVLAAALLTRRR